MGGEVLVRVIAFALIFAFAFSSFGNEQEIQRALIQRDQQSAEFAAGVNRGSLENLHQRQLMEAGRPLHPDPEIARQLRPYERERMAREREGFVLQLPPPRVNSGSDPDLGALPLPGGPRHGVDPVPSQRFGG
jgi:hypothetical protein